MKPTPYLFVPFLFLFVFAFCENPNKYSERGLELLEEKRDLSALILFDKALEIESNNPLSLYGKGTIMIKNSITTDIGYRMLEQSFPNLTGRKRGEVGILLAKYYYSKKDFNKALEYVANAKEEGNIKEEIYIIESSIYSAKNQYQKTISSLTKGYEEYQTAIFMEHIVAEHIKHKNYRKAYQILLDLLRKENNNQDKYLYNLFNISYILKDKKNALKYLNLLQEKNSKYLPSYKWGQIISDIRNNLYSPEFDMI